MDLQSYIFAFFDYITYTKIGGVIPLDIIAHFIVGMIITIGLLKLKLRLHNVAITLLLISVFKEFLDYLRMGNVDFLEGIKDIFVSMSYLIILVIARLTRKKNLIEFRNTSKNFKIA